jgi:hypothetical protein
MTIMMMVDFPCLCSSLLPLLRSILVDGAGDEGTLLPSVPADGAGGEGTLLPSVLVDGAGGEGTTEGTSTIWQGSEKELRKRESIRSDELQLCYKPDKYHKVLH